MLFVRVSGRVLEFRGRAVKLVHVEFSSTSYFCCNLYGCENHELSL